MSSSSGLKSPERSRPKPAGSKAVAGGVPSLNKYIRSRVPKGESANYLDLAKALQDATKQGSTAGKSLLPKVLPGLCKFGDLPAAINPLLIAVTRVPDKKDDYMRKLQRVAFYLLQASFSAGTGGTSQPYAVQSGDDAPYAVVNLAMASPAWADAKAAGATFDRQRLALRLLAAMARSDADEPPGSEDIAVGELTAVLGNLLTSSSSAQTMTRKKSGIFRVGSKDDNRSGGGTGSASARASVVQAVLPAIRVGLAPHPSAARDFLGAGYDGLGGGDPVGTRHALAIAAAAALADPVNAVARTDKLLAATLTVYGQTGLVYGPPQSGTSRSPQKGSSGGEGRAILVLSDPWARVYLARLCAAVVHSDDFSATSSREQAAPYWAALLLLATRDPQEMVSMEAIRQLSGSRPSKAADLTCRSAARTFQHLAIPQKDKKHQEASQHSAVVQLKAEGSVSPSSPTAKASQRAAIAAEVAAEEVGMMRIRAWMMILKETQRSTLPPNILSSKKAGPLPTGEGSQQQTQPSETLIAFVVARLRTALKSRHAPLVCSAARTAAALCEARALAVEEHGTPARGGPVVVRAMELLQKDLRAVLDGRCDAQQKCGAVSALVWMQLDARTPLVTPAALYSHVSTGGVTFLRAGALEPWPPHLVSSLLKCLVARSVASNSMAPLLLKCSVAVAAAAPSHVDPEQLTLLWATALECGPSGCSAALHASFEILDSPPPPIACQAGSTSSASVVVSGAREAAAWAQLQRVAAWWLGANANLATGEIVWAAQRRPIEGVSASDPALEVLARSGQRNALLTAAVSQLQRALVIGSWQVRVAAAQALGKVAVRSPEPYRLQCYSILKGVVATGGSEDPLGLTSTVMPILRILDACYSSACILDQCIEQWGDLPEDWPQQHLESLRSRHQQLLADVSSKVCHVPPDLFLPMGWASLPFIRGMPDVGPGGLVAGPRTGGRVPDRLSAPASTASGLEGSGLEELLEDNPVPSSPAGSAAASAPTDSGYGPDSPDRLDATLGQAGDEQMDSSTDMVTDEGGGNASVEGRTALVTKDFNPSGDKDGEIEVEEGEEVVVERMESDEWCQVRTLSGEVGAVPMSHLELVPEGPETSERRDIEGEAMMLSLSDGLGSEQIDAVTGMALMRGGDAKEDGEGGKSASVGVAAVGGLAAARLAGKRPQQPESSTFEFDSPSAKAEAEQDFAESTDDTFVSTGFTSGLFGSPARQLSAEGKPQPTVNGQHSTAKSPLKVVSYPSKTDAAGLSGPNPVLAQGANASLRNEDVGSSGADDTEVDASGGGTGGPSAFDPLGDSESLGAAASIATLGTATDPLGGSKSFEAAATGATGGTTTDSFGGYQAFETAAFGATDAFGGAEPFEAAATGATGGTATCSFGGSEVFGALAFGATGPLGGSESFEAAATDPTGSAASNSFDTSEPLGAAAFGASFGAAGAGFAPYSEPLNKSTSFGSSGDTGGNSHGGGGVPASAASSAAAAPADAASETATGSFGGSAFKTSSVGGSESAALHGATAGFGAFDPPSTAAFGSSDPFADRAGEAFASVPFEAPRDTFGSAPVGFSAQGVGGASEPYPKLSSSETLSPEGSVRGFVEVAAGADRAKAAVEPPRAAAKGEGTTAAVLYDFIAQEDGEVNVSKGDVVIVANSEGGWSTVKTQSGTEGLVPTDYLSLGDSRSAARSSQLPAKATVLYDFTGEVQEELSVKAGDAVVVRAETDGWFDVIRDADGAAGLVPASYLQLV